jgi:hypothetical protein
MRHCSRSSLILRLLLLAALSAIPTRAADTISPATQPVAPITNGGAQHIRKIILIAGKKSHPPGAHEYEKGCRLIKACQIDSFRKFMLNALLWTAHADVPEGGVESTVPPEFLK